MQEEEIILEQEQQQDPQPPKKPKFNPNAKFEPIKEEKPPFDPNKPFEKKNLSDTGSKVGESETHSTENKIVDPITGRDLSNIPQGTKKVKPPRIKSPLDFVDKDIFYKATDAPYIKKPITEIDIKEEERKTKAYEKNEELAIENTAERALRQRGITAQKGSVLFNIEKQKVKDLYEQRDILGYRKNSVYHNYIDKKTGAEYPALDRSIGGYEGLTRGWNEATEDNEAAHDFVNNMTDQERVDYLKQEKKDTPQPNGYMGEQLGGIGSIAHFAGGAAPFLGKAAAGTAIGAGLIAAAPESAGASLAGLPAVAAFAMTAPDMVNQGARNEIIRRYQILKQEHPEASEVDLMKQARESGLVVGGIGGAVTNALFMGEGGNVMKSGLSNESKSVAGKFVKNMVKSSLKMGGTTAGVTALEQVEGNVAGVKTSAEDIVKNTAQSFKDNATTGLLLYGMMHGIPKAVKSAFKYALVKDGKLPEIREDLQQKETAGLVPEGTTEKVMGDLDAYKGALNKTSGGLSPEAQASVAGLIQAKDNILAEMKEKDNSQHGVYEKRIEAIDEQIKDISRTNKPLEHEIDEATGQPLEKPSFDNIAKRRVDVVADKISKGKPIEDVVDVKAENNFPEELEKALNRISKEEKSKNKDSKNPNTELSDNIDKYLSQKEKEVSNIPNSPIGAEKSLSETKTEPTNESKTESTPKDDIPITEAQTGTTNIESNKIGEGSEEPPVEDANRHTWWWENNKESGGTGIPTEEKLTELTPDPEMTKMANAINDAHVEGKFGVEAMDNVLSKLQDTELKSIYNKAKENIEKGVTDLNKLRERLLTTKHGSEADQAALLYDLVYLKSKEKTLQHEIINSTDGAQEQFKRQLVDVQNDILDNALANRYVGRSASSVFRLRQLWADKEGTLQDFQEQYKASKGLKELTPEEEKIVKDSYMQIRELKAKLEAAREELEKSKYSSGNVDKELARIEKIKEDAFKMKKSERFKNLEESIKKSNDRIGEARERLRKLRGGMNDITHVLPATVAEISKIAGEKVYQGVLKFSELVKSVLHEVHEIFPEWKEEDVRKHLLPEVDSEKYYKYIKKADLTKQVLKEKVAAYKDAQKAYAVKMFEWQKDRRMDLLSNRSVKEKVIDSILRWQRFAVLSYPSTFVKLAAVVAHQLTLKPLKFLIQKGVSAITPKNVSDKQGIWGNPSATALGKYYSTFIRNFSLQNLKEQFSGVDTKEIMYGKGMVYDEFPMAKGLLEMPGRSHGYVKSFIKNPEFQYAHEQLTSSSISKMQRAQEKLKDESLSTEEITKLHDEYNENDITKEEVMERINKLALDHGKWAILMNDNKFVEKFRSWANNAGVTGAFVKSELPILKIPVNYVSRAFAIKYGLIQALLGRSNKSSDGGFPGVIKLIYKGTKDLTPEQADLLGKSLNLGTMGASFFVFGYLNSNNIKHNDDGSYEMFGVPVNKNLVHSPELESMFSGATTKQEYDKEGHKKASEWIKGYVEADADIATKSPFTSMLKYGFLPNIAGALISKQTFDKKLEKISDATSKKITDMVVPGFSKQIASATDVVGGGFHPYGETIKRKPKGDNLDRFWQTFEMAIPGLRQNVPEYVKDSFQIKDSKTKTKREATKEEVQKHTSLQEELYQKMVKNIPRTKFYLDKYGDISLDDKGKKKTIRGWQLKEGQLKEVEKKLHIKASGDAKTKLFGKDN